MINHTERADKWIGEDCGMDYRTYLPAAHVGVRCTVGGGLKRGCLCWKVLVIGILITKENDDKIFMDLGVLQ